LVDCRLVIRPIELTGVPIELTGVSIDIRAVDLTSTVDCLVIASVTVYKRVAA